MNNKGQLQGWVEGILFISLILVGFGLLVVGLNTEWGQSNDPTFDLPSIEAAGDRIESVERNAESLQENVNTGDWNILESIIVLGSILTIVKGIVLLIFQFITGRFITDIVVGLLNLDPILAIVLRTLFIFAVVFIVIKLIFRIKS